MRKRHAEIRFIVLPLFWAGLSFANAFLKRSTAMLLFLSVGLIVTSDLSPSFEFSLVGDAEARGRNRGGGGWGGGRGGGRGGGVSHGGSKSGSVGGGSRGGSVGSSSGGSRGSSVGSSRGGSRGSTKGTSTRSSRGVSTGKSLGKAATGSRGRLTSVSRGRKGVQVITVISGRPKGIMKSWRSVLGSRKAISVRATPVRNTKSKSSSSSRSVTTLPQSNQDITKLSLKRSSSAGIRRLVASLTDRELSGDGNDDGLQGESKPSGLMASAIAYLEKDDFDNAAKLLEVLANENNTQAQLLYAELNFTGRGHPQHFEKALFWALSAFLGGQEKAAPLAAKLRRFISADAQNTIIRDLGSVLRKRSMNGDVSAIPQLAAWHFALAEPADLNQAYSWYAVAVALGDNASERERDELLKQLSPSQVKKAQVDAKAIFNRIKSGKG